MTCATSHTIFVLLYSQLTQIQFGWSCSFLVAESSFLCFYRSQRIIFGTNNVTRALFRTELYTSHLPKLGMTLSLTWICSIQEKWRHLSITKEVNSLQLFNLFSYFWCLNTVNDTFAYIWFLIEAGRNQVHWTMCYTTRILGMTRLMMLFCRVQTFVM